MANLNYTYMTDLMSITVAPSQTGNIPYRVEIRPVKFPDATYTTIYQGSVYCDGSPVTIYLNDILETYMDDYSWFKDLTISSTEITPAISRVHVEARLVLDTYSGPLTYSLSNIFNGYLSPNAKRVPIFGQTSNQKLQVFTEMGYNVVPHIPLVDKLVLSNDRKPFTMPVRMFVNTAATKLNIDYKNPDGTIAYSTTKSTNGYPIYGVNVTMTMLSLGTNIVNEGCKIIASVDGTESPIAVIDYNPAEYYLMWINRYGATQCQPFCKKNTLSESVTTSYITSSTNESVVSNKSVDYTWTLNSHWLTYDEHSEFESLLTSKYVWLYDTKNIQFYPVNVTDSKWSYKNSSNNKKPFNLTVNIKSARHQNIGY